MSSVIRKLQEHTWLLSVVTGALSVVMYFQYRVLKVRAQNVW